VSAAVRALPLPESDEQRDRLALERLSRGEVGALGEIYERHHASVHRFVSRATSDARDVDDIVHNAFLLVPETAHRFDGRASCRAWLLGIAANVIHRRSRSLARYAKMLGRFGEEVLTHGSRGPSPERSAMTGDDRAALTAALERIGDRKRVVLVMAEVEGMSCDEIASVLSVPVGTVWTRLHHARRELRALLEKRGVMP
jgi:RNA polymerase sigma-70 factor (ECF subfamily)